MRTITEKRKGSRILQRQTQGQSSVSVTRVMRKNGEGLSMDMVRAAWFLCRWVFPGIRGWEDFLNIVAFWKQGAPIMFNSVNGLSLSHSMEELSWESLMVGDDLKASLFTVLVCWPACLEG